MALMMRMVLIAFLNAFDDEDDYDDYDDQDDAYDDSDTDTPIV